MAHATSTEIAGNTCAARQSQWVAARRRRRVRGREPTQGACVKEASLNGLNSTLTAEDIITDIDKMVGNSTENFRTIPETSKKNKKDCLASSKTCVLYDSAPKLGSDSPCIDSPESCSEIIEKLNQCGRSEQQELLQRLKKQLRKLALSKHGSRVVQKILEVAAGSDRDDIIEELADHIVDLYESPHGNHVLSRAIEVLPAAKINFVITALHGRGFAVSKHRYGCRIVCRLLEHAGKEQIDGLMADIVENVEALAKQAYGNFVVQSILEHGASWRTLVISKLLGIFSSLCVDRSGSLVAQRMLDSCDDDVKNCAIECLNREGLIEVACSRYGSYVVEQLASMQSRYPAALQSADILSKGIVELQRSEYAQRVIIAFEL